MPEGGVGATAVCNNTNISAPSISLTEPQNNSSYTIGSSINISATGSSPNGGIGSVALYSNSVLLANDNTAPYSTVWENAPQGSHGIYAILTDELGVSVSSSTANITIADGSDCAGVYNGTAYIDDCGICVEGTTGKLPCSNGGEAEDACSFDGIVDSNHGGYTGSGFVNFDNVQGASMSFNIQSSSAGMHSFSIAYANGDAVARPMILMVGDTEFTISFDATGSWATWQEYSISAEFSAGVVECLLTAQDASGGPNIDKFIFADSALVIGTCTTDCSGLYGGTAFLDECGECVGGLTNRTACEQDCNGDWGGTATTDECGICSGGVTEQVPCSEYQAEDACYYDGTVDSNNEGFRANGFVNLDNNVNSTITFNLYATENVEVPLRVRYANGSDASRGATIVVNGETQIANQTFEPTANWTTWTTQEIILSFTAGLNTINFISTSESGGANYDAIRFNSNSGILFSCDDVNVSQTISLVHGWNLVSLSVSPQDLAVLSIFPNAIHVKDEDSFFDSNQPLFMNTLNEIVPGKGYLVYSSSETDIVIQGLPIVSQVNSLDNGWNLLGNNRAEQITIQELEQEIPCSIQIIKNFDSFYQPNTNSTLEFIEPGEAYFIYLEGCATGE